MARNAYPLRKTDPCWCGSGKAYEDCHLYRNREEPLPSSQMQHEIRKYFQEKRCLHPLASTTTCGKPIFAHTIQKAGAIQKLMGANNHVLTFLPLNYDMNGTLKIHQRGWKKASTFFGFCSIHDTTLFRVLEQYPFVASDEQCFLVGYRALCHELYQKTSAQTAEAFMTQNMDRGMAHADQFYIQRRLSIMSAGREKGISDITAMKKFYDDAFISNDYGAIKKAVIFFDGDIGVASTGLVHVDFDINGKRLQNLGNPNCVCEGFAFGVVSTDTGGAFVLSWPDSFKICENFLESLLNLNYTQMVSVLIEFMFAYVENTYFSDEWWHALTPYQKKRIMSLAGRTIQYGSPVGYSFDTFVDWKISSIIR